MQDLYSWIDELPLSRPKRHIARDFSDAVLAAEIVKHFCPRMVDLHNYQPANSTTQKQTNWQTLNSKVFKKIGLNVPPNVILGVASQKPGVIEVVLNNLRLKLQQHLAPPRARTDLGRSPHDDYDGHDVDGYDEMGAAAAAPMPPPPPPRAMGRGSKKKGSTLPPLGGRAATMPPQRKGAAAPRPPPPRGGRIPGTGAGRRIPQRAAPRDDYYDEPPRAARGLPGGGGDAFAGYEELVTELEDCQQQMGVMAIKIEKLTRLVHLKDKRIEDLQRTLRDQR